MTPSWAEEIPQKAVRHRLQASEPELMAQEPELMAQEPEPGRQQPTSPLLGVHSRGACNGGLTAAFLVKYRG